MYAKYVYGPGSTTANVVADVVAIVTGETNVANLSAACNQGASTILSTIAAGWTAHDVVTGNNTKYLKAPLADNANVYKYVGIDAYTSTGYLRLKVYETWNNSTHAGTNLAYNSDNQSYAQQIDTTNGGTLHIFASARHLVMASLVGTTWGSSSYNGPCGCVERTRVGPWDTVAAGWPPFLWLNFGWCNYGNPAYDPRHLQRLGTTVTGSNASLTLYVFPFGPVNTALSNCTGQDQKVPDDSGGNVIPLWPLSVANYADMPIHYGDISSLCDIWLIPGNIASNYDIIQKNGNDYLCMRAQNVGQVYAFRKG